jgi:hypothetical protein
MPRTKFKLGKTERGFSYKKFGDRYGQECSLQDSSAACYAAVWLGVDNTGPHMGNKSVDNGRMHLDRPRVKQLIRELQKWLDNDCVK